MWHQQHAAICCYSCMLKHAWASVCINNVCHMDKFSFLLKDDAVVHVHVKKNVLVNVAS